MGPRGVVSCGFMVQGYGLSRASGLVSPGLVCFSFRALTVNAAWSEVPMSLSCTDDENRCFLLLQGGSRA